MYIWTYSLPGVLIRPCLSHQTKKIEPTSRPVLYFDLYIPLTHHLLLDLELFIHDNLDAREIIDIATLYLFHFHTSFFLNLVCRRILVRYNKDTLEIFNQALCYNVYGGCMHSF